MTERKKKGKRKKKKAWFKKGLLIYLVIISIVFISLLGILWSKLAGYQKELDANEALLNDEKLSRQAPQLCFESKMNSMDYDAWINAYNTANPDSLEKEEDIRNFIEGSIINSPVTLWKASEFTDAAPVYLVKNDTSEVAKFYLTNSNNEWTVSEIRLLVTGECEGTITVPSMCHVYCNEKLLNDSYANNSNPVQIDGYQEEIVNPISYTTYSVSGMLSEPTLTVDSGDSSYEIIANKDGNYYLATDNQTFQDKAESFIKSLLHYYSQGKNSASANMASALDHVASGSVASSVIRQSLDGVTWRYPTNTTYETSVSKTYIVSENCYFVDVEYRDVNADSPDTEVYRVYFLDLGSGFKIYNFAMK